MIQLLVYLLLAALLGFAIGWLVHPTAARAGSGAEQARWRERLEGAERERERLAAELSAAQRARTDLQAVLDRMRTGLSEVDGAPAGGTAAGEEAERLLEEVAAELDVAHRRIAQLERDLEAARRSESEARAPASARQAPAAPGGAETVPARAGRDREEDAGEPPERLASPQGGADNLKRINGIGPSIEKRLNGLGIYHFRQIAEFTSANVTWVDQHLPFKGRIEREDWIGQARALAAGGGETVRSSEGVGTPHS